jgi:hypothetical protein
MFGTTDLVVLCRLGNLALNLDVDGGDVDRYICVFEMETLTNDSTEVKKNG